MTEVEGQELILAGCRQKVRGNADRHEERSADQDVDITRRDWKRDPRPPALLLPRVFPLQPSLVADQVASEERQVFAWIRRRIPLLEPSSFGYPVCLQPDGRCSRRYHSCWVSDAVWSAELDCQRVPTTSPPHARSLAFSFRQLPMLFK